MARKISIRAGLYQGPTEHGPTGDCEQGGGGAVSGPRRGAVVTHQKAAAGGEPGL
jgi:hypothetical protein